jgi:hypothetical protein
VQLVVGSVRGHLRTAGPSIRVPLGGRRPTIEDTSSGRSSREIVEGERPSRLAISRTATPRACAMAISSRSVKDKYRPDVPPRCRREYGCSTRAEPTRPTPTTPAPRPSSCYAMAACRPSSPSITTPCCASRRPASRPGRGPHPGHLSAACPVVSAHPRRPAPLVVRRARRPGAANAAAG